MPFPDPATLNAPTPTPSRGTEVRFGLRANAGQFAWLMLMNAFGGGMVGHGTSLRT